MLYFAAAKSYTRKQSDFFEAPMAINKLYDHLEKLYPGIKMKVLDSCALTVNEEYVDSNASDSNMGALSEGDEVAIIPPVSSG